MLLRSLDVPALTAAGFAALVLGLAAGPARATTAGRYVGDLSSGDRLELAVAKVGSGTEGVSLWNGGEAALRRGDLPAAETAFRAARGRLPHLGVAARRH